MNEVTDMKIKPLWKRCLCRHSFTGGVKTVYDLTGRRRHAFICRKCGKREYVVCLKG